MKQVAQNYKSGELAVLDVPPPACAPGGVLIRSLYSLISTGTELMKVGEAKLSMLGKAEARPAEVQLGETAVVIGLGLVGQLVVRLLVAAGVRVFGVDTVEDRCRMAEKAGALHCSSPDEAGIASLERSLLEASNGLGADRILLAAGGHSNGPVETAARLARDRAPGVDIGKTQLDLPWEAYYAKELDGRFSRSDG